MNTETIEPCGWIFQHDETGRMTFCENDGINTREVFQALNGERYTFVEAAYPESALDELRRDAERYRWLRWRLDPEDVRELVFDYPTDAESGDPAHVQFGRLNDKRIDAAMKGANTK